MSKVASITRAGGLIVNPQHATPSTTQYARGYVSEGAVVTDNLVLWLDPADYASYPGERSIATTWSDYQNHQADYDVVGDDGVILLGTYTSWAGRFPFTVARTGNHTVMFDYWSDNDSVTWSIDNDGVNNNDYNTTLTANKKKQTFSKTVNLTSTGSSTMYMRPHATGSKVYVSNFRFFYDKKYVSDFSAGTDTWIGGAGSVAGNIDGIGGQDNNLRFTCSTTPNSSHYIHFNNGGNWSSVGDTIRITFDYYVPSGQSNIDGIGMYTYGPTVVQPYYSQMNTTDAWTSIDVTFDVSQSYGFVLYGVDNPATNYFEDTGGDDVFYIRNFTYTETALNDLSGNGNDAILVNGPTFGTSGGGSVSFDGTNDYAVIPDSSDWNFGTEPFAIEQWLRFTDFTPAGDTWSSALQQYASEGDRNGWMVFYSNTQEWRLECSAASFYPGNIVTGCSLNTWYLFTISRDGSSFKQYINGVLKQTDTSNPTFTNIAAPMYVANYSATDLHEFQGDMGPLRIYKGRSLSAAEVKQNFNAERNRFGI